jgi:hypothetical protein
MGNIFNRITQLHFYTLYCVLLNWAFKYITNWSLDSTLVFALKIIICITGFVLFFKNLKPVKKITLYFSYYFISPLILGLFWLFGGIFLGILSSIVLAPIAPKELQYEKDTIVVYDAFKGFFGACCTYEVSERKLGLFEKSYGEMQLDGPISNDNSSFTIANDSIVHNYK